MKKITSLLVMCLMYLGLVAQPAVTPTGSLSLPTTSDVLDAIEWSTDAKILHNYYLDATKGVLVLSPYVVGQTTTKPAWWATNGAGSGTASQLYDPFDEFQGLGYYQNETRYWTVRNDRAIDIQFTGADSIKMTGYANASSKYFVAKLFEVGAESATQVGEEAKITNKAWEVAKFNDLDASKVYILEITSNNTANCRVGEVAFYFTPAPIAANDATVSSIKYGEIAAVKATEAGVEYTHALEVPYGTNVADIALDVTTTDALATVGTITYPTALPGNATFSVTSQDETTTADYVVYIYEEPASDDNFLSHVEFSNGFDAFVVSGEETNTVTAYYMAGTTAPSVVETSIAHNGVSYAINADNITITAESGAQRVYALTLEAVTPYDDYSKVFDGTETWIKTGNPTALDTDAGRTEAGTLRGLCINQGKEDENNKRISEGKNRIYFFVGAAAKVQFEQGTQNRHIVVYDNGAEIFNAQSEAGVGGTIEFNLDAAAANHMIAIVNDRTGGDFGVRNIQLTIAGSDNANLASLTVDGADVEGFAADVVEYDIELAPGTTQVPVVSGVAADANAQSVEVSELAALPGDVTVTVTAENGTQKVYTIHFTVALPGSDNADLASLKVGGADVEGFAVDVLEYTVVLPADATEHPAVEAVAADANAQGVVISELAEVVGDVTITVTAENGTEKVYTVHFVLEQLPDVLNTITETTLFNFADMTNGDIEADTYFSEAQTLLLKAGAKADNKHFTLEGNSKTIDGISFAKRLKTNGSSADNARLIKFQVAGKAKITVYAVSSSSSETRNAHLLADGVDVHTWAITGTAASYTYNKTDEAEVQYAISVENGINFYGIRVFIGEDPADAVISETTFINFSELAAGDVTEVVYLNKLGVVGSSSKKWNVEENEKALNSELTFTKRLKSGGAASTAGRYLRFNVSGACRIEILTMSGSNGNTREMEVRLGAYDGELAATLSVTSANAEIETLVYEYTGSEPATIYIIPKNSINYYAVAVIFGSDESPYPTSLAQAQAEGIRYIGGVLYNDNNFRLEVFNVAGQKVADTRNNLDMNYLQSGMYLVRFNNQVLKLVK